MKQYLAHYHKAIQGAIGAGVVAIFTALVFVTPGHINEAEWQLIVSAVIGGAGLPIVGPKNAPKPARRRNQRGASDLVIIAIVAALAFVIAYLIFRHH